MLLLTVSVLLLPIQTARAADSRREAKKLFEAATAHYAVGDFAKAADEYQQAYQLKPDPALLYNAAQAYRLANVPEKALILYRNYLNLYPNEGNSDEVRAQITKLKDAIAAADKAKNNPPTETVAPKPIPDEAKTPPPTPIVENTTPPSTKTSDRPAHTPVYKKWWLWTIVGVAVVGGVVGGTLAATLPSGSWNNAQEVGPGSAAGLKVQF